MAFVRMLQTLTILTTLSLVHAQCSKTDDTCWGTRALHFTNVYRRKSGRSELLIAPTPLIRNARKHSGAMARRNDLFHQDLDSVRVGCGLNVCAENVAMHHDVDGDRAALCVQLWIDSPPHRENLLIEAQSMAFAVVQRDGRIWCTQIFARVDDSDASRKCHAAHDMRGRKGRFMNRPKYTAVPIKKDGEGEDEVDEGDVDEQRKNAATEEIRENAEKDVSPTSISNVKGRRGQKCYKICIKD